MVECRARVPSPGHDMKKPKSSFRRRLFSEENKPGALHEATAYEPNAEQHACRTSAFFSKFFRSLPTCRKVFQKVDLE
jgi:hypothetical protein